MKSDIISTSKYLINQIQNAAQVKMTVVAVVGMHKKILNMKDMIVAVAITIMKKNMNVAVATTTRKSMIVAVVTMKKSMNAAAIIMKNKRGFYGSNIN